MNKTVSNVYPVGQFSDNDMYWMEQALNFAREASDKGEVPVGAVLVKGDECLAGAHNCRELSGNPIAHAEMLVIQAAAHTVGNWRLTNTTLYVTLEPCAMCAGTIVLARIPKVVYAATDPKAGAAGSLYNIVQDERLNHQVELVSGVCAEDSSALLKAYFRSLR